MRYKIALAIIASGCLVILGLFVIRQKNSPLLQNTPAQSGLPPAQASSHLPDEASPLTNSSGAQSPVTAEQSHITGGSSNVVRTAGNMQSGPDAAKAAQAAYEKRRISELEDLAMDNDPSSLDVILSELTNADPEIRRAALEATIQFGS